MKKKLMIEAINWAIKRAVKSLATETNEVIKQEVGHLKYLDEAREIISKLNEDEIRTYLYRYGSEIKEKSIDELGKHLTEEKQLRLTLL